MTACQCRPGSHGPRCRAPTEHIISDTGASLSRAGLGPGPPGPARRRRAGAAGAAPSAAAGGHRDVTQSATVTAPAPAAEGFGTVTSQSGTVSRRRRLPGATGVAPGPGPGPGPVESHFESTGANFQPGGADSRLGIAGPSELVTEPPHDSDSGRLRHCSASGLPVVHLKRLLPGSRLRTVTPAGYGRPRSRWRHGPIKDVLL